VFSQFDKSLRYIILGKHRLYWARTKTTIQVFREKEESHEKDQPLGFVVPDPFFSLRGHTRSGGWWPEPDLPSPAGLLRGQVVSVTATPLQAL
jgi:hypothetical protein